MLNTIPQPTIGSRAWPMTREAWDQLVGEIARLREDLSTMAGQGLEEGIVRLPVAIAARRLDTLQEALDRCEVVDDGSCLAIGRRATLRDDEGESIPCELTYPGDGDPRDGRISADSPLGMAVIGARAGDVVDVDAPAGRWSVRVLAID
jgi:transcription elongation GreA/GreB family factor